MKECFKIIPLIHLLACKANLADIAGFYSVSQPCHQKDNLWFQRFSLSCHYSKLFLFQEYVLLLVFEAVILHTYVNKDLRTHQCKIVGKIKGNIFITGILCTFIKHRSPMMTKICQSASDVYCLCKIVLSRLSEKHNRMD